MTPLRAVCAVLAPVVLLVAIPALDSPAQPRSRAWLSGRLLVATDSIGDPRFARTVIYLVRHDADGALGVVINRPVGAVSYESALQPFKLDVPSGSGEITVHYGGPVEPRAGSVLHTPDWTGEGTTVVGGRFAYTTDPKILQALARGAGPRRALFLLGFAGWAPGQLEAELGKGVWDVAIPDEGLVFDLEPERKWRDAAARRLLDL